MQKGMNRFGVGPPGPAEPPRRCLLDALPHLGHLAGGNDPLQQGPAVHPVLEQYFVETHMSQAAMDFEVTRWFARDPPFSKRPATFQAKQSGNMVYSSGGRLLSYAGRRRFLPHTTPETGARHRESRCLGP